jgi:alpha-beta hydrolase superfamily lysophospholipase
MKVIKSFLNMSDGHEVYCELYQPETPIGHVHIIHGMAEHIGRYEEFAHFLAGKGFVVSGHDQRGHGKTAQRNGVQGHFADQSGFSRIVADVQETIGEVRPDGEELPLILFGHSMGSFVARRFIQLYSEDVSRAVLSGSGGDPGLAGKAGLAFAIAAARTRGKAETSQALGKLTFGSFMKQFKGESSAYAWLSRDAAEVAKYEADPMSGTPSTNQFYVDLFTGIDLIHKPGEVSRIRSGLPLLLISGSDDPVGGNGKGIFQAAEQYRRAGLDNVKVYLAEGGRHELLHEIGRRAHYETIADWMLGYD